MNFSKIFKKSLSEKSSKYFGTFFFFHILSHDIIFSHLFMPIFVNHYMQLVADHPQILDETADIYAHKGAWSEYF